MLYENLVYVFILDRAFNCSYFQTINTNIFGRDDDDDDDDDDYCIMTIIANMHPLLSLCKALG